MNQKVQVTVDELLKKITENGSKKFSKADYQLLTYAIISDKTFKTKKFFIKANELVEESGSVAESMDAFLNQFLKHVGIGSEEERQSIIDSFEFSPKMVDFMQDLIEEAMHQYLEAGKSLKIFKDKKLQLTLKKIVRTGKYEGQKTYKKSVVDKDLQVIRLQQKAAAGTSV